MVKMLDIIYLHSLVKSYFSDKCHINLMSPKLRINIVLYCKAGNSPVSLDIPLALYGLYIMLFYNHAVFLILYIFMSRLLVISAGKNANIIYK